MTTRKSLQKIKYLISPHNFHWNTFAHINISNLCSKMHTETHKGLNIKHLLQLTSEKFKWVNKFW